MGTGSAAGGCSKRQSGSPITILSVCILVLVAVGTIVLSGRPTIGDRVESADARIAERDLAIPALSVAASRAGGFVATSDLIEALEHELRPNGEDAEILSGRRDTKFSQKVRNLVSHRGSSTSIFAMGYATYEGDGLRITERGRELLDQSIALMGHAPRSTPSSSRLGGRRADIGARRGATSPQP